MSPTPDELKEAAKKRWLEKLRRQVWLYERKGNFNTSAHTELERLLNPSEAVSPRNAKQAKPEETVVK